MNNAQKITRITREDFDSLFLWRVFWKLIKAETPLIFCTKVLLVGTGFIVLLFLLILLGELA